MTRYIHQQVGWPKFRWDEAALAPRLADVRHRQGRLIGRMEALGFNLRAEAVLTTLTEDVLKSSEIEGEQLDREQVRSSIARRLGMDIGALTPADRNVEGVVEMMLDATQKFAEPLTDERLFAWHAAPEAKHLSSEMADFLAWFEGGPVLDPVLKAALAHLWFVTIHPFEDGNGRIARAIADMALARSERSPQRFYSMSAQIRAERKAYYDILEATQKADLDITQWLSWFLACLERAIEGAEATLASVMAKARFWEAIKDQPLNERQHAMINRLLNGFEGKLTTSKWATLTKASQDTALRDITDLVERGILVRDPGGGRSTSYSLRAVE